MAVNRKMQYYADILESQYLGSKIIGENGALWRIFMEIDDGNHDLVASSLGGVPIEDYLLRVDMYDICKQGRQFDSKPNAKSKKAIKAGTVNDMLGDLTTLLKTVAGRTDGG